MKQAGRTRAQKYIFSRVGHDEMDELIEELLPWALTIWHGSEDAMREYLHDPKALETIIHVQRRLHDNKVVGATIAKMFDLHYQGKDIILCKLGLGVDPEYRGNSFVLRHLMKSLPEAKLWYPRRPFYLLSTLVHPVTYRLSCQLLGDRMYPYYGAADQPDFGRPELRELLEFLVETFDIEKADTDPTNPILFKEVFRSQERKEENEYWTNHQHPAIRFYLQHLPDYSNNDCIIMLAPLDLTYLARTMVKTLVRARIHRMRRGVPQQFRRSSRAEETAEARPDAASKRRA